MKKILSFLVCAAIVAGSVFLQGCESEEFTPIDNSIANSTELEEYIIAGIELQLSINAFTAVLNTTELEVTFDEEGRKIKHLIPAPGVIAIVENLENSRRTLSNKRDALLQRFPEFSSFREDESRRYFTQSIQQSTRIAGKFSELRNSSFRSPRLRSGIEFDDDCPGSSHFTDDSDLFDFLSGWATESNSDYLELWIFQFSDNTWGTFLHPDAGRDAYGFFTYLPNFDERDGQWYVGGNRVVGIGHTHIWSSTPTYPSDYFNTPDGVERFIYFNGALYFY